jgi:hypothetical protein
MYRVTQAAIVLVVVLGALAAFHRQGAGTKLGVPDAGERIAWALAPHALLVLGLLFWARSTKDLLILLTSSLTVWATSNPSGHDELGLEFMIFPLLQFLLVGFALGVIWLLRFWPRLRGRFTRRS